MGAEPASLPARPIQSVCHQGEYRLKNSGGSDREIFWEWQGVGDGAS